VSETARPERLPRSAQFALAACVFTLLGLLLYRGYGSGLGTRPTETVSVRFDLNHAERSDLEQVPGVGPKLAQAIIDHRGEKGRFQSLDQLRDVKGVGPATFDKVRPYLRVDPVPKAVDDLGPVPVLERKRPVETKPAAANGRKLQPGDPPINVNIATMEQLLMLPDVGPVTAQAIIAARPFASVIDLDRVKGIGPKRLEKLRPFVKVQ
jgi:competence protein ComEA